MQTEVKKEDSTILAKNKMENENIIIWIGRKYADSPEIDIFLKMYAGQTKILKKQ